MCQNNVSTVGLNVDEIGFVYILPSICITGILLNILNLVVFFKRHLPGSSFTYLSALALADMVTLTLVAPIGLIRCQECQQHRDHVKSLYEIYVYLPIGNMAACTSVWITLAFTVERYIFVRLPVVARKICSPSRARGFVGGICICAVLLNLPFFFPYKVTEANAITHTYFGQSKGFTVYSWIRVSLAKLVPIVILAVMNTLLVLEIWKANKRRKRMVFQNDPDARRQRAQNKLTVMLICVSVMFLIAHLLEPFSHAQVYTSLFGECKLVTDEYKIFRLISNILEVSSYSLNFVVYSAFNAMFRRALLTLVPCKIKNIHRINPGPHTRDDAETQG